MKTQGSTLKVKKLYFYKIEETNNPMVFPLAFAKQNDKIHQKYEKFDFFNISDKRLVIVSYTFTKGSFTTYQKLLDEPCRNEFSV